VLIGAMSCGGIRFLSDEDAVTIDSRLDEAYRRKMIDAR